MTEYAPTIRGLKPRQAQRSIALTHAVVTEYAPTIRGLKPTRLICFHPLKMDVTEYAPTIRGLKLTAEVVIFGNGLHVGDGIRPDNQGIETYMLLRTVLTKSSCDGIRPDNQGIETSTMSRRAKSLSSVRDGIRPDNQGIETNTRASPTTTNPSGWVTEYAPTIRGLKPGAARYHRGGIAGMVTEYAPTIRGLKPRHAARCRSGETGVTEYAPTIRGLKPAPSKARTPPGSTSDGIRPDNQGIETQVVAGSGEGILGIGDGIRPDNQGIETP